MTRTLILMLFFNQFIIGQNKDYASLSKKIDSMAVEDQKWRTMLSKIQPGHIDSTKKKLAKAMFTKTDSMNQKEVKMIFNFYGYPTVSKVGQNSCHNFWLLVQHCDKDIDFQEKVLKEMEILITKNECSRTEYAYLTDRVKINKGQEQIYGTQVELNSTGTEYVPKKLFNPKDVDKRREEMNLVPVKLQDYLNNMKRDFLNK